MTIIIRTISDTHCQHSRLKIEPCHILIHSGDACRTGTSGEMRDFLDWFKDQPAKHKIFVPGNHDQCLDEGKVKFFDRDLHRELLIGDWGITYLQDRSAHVENFHFYGMPWTPEFFDWAFMGKPSGDYPEFGKPLMRDVCEQIPSDVDILICHGPPAGILDINTIGKNVGSLDLRIVVDKIKPKLVIFGHIHGGRGHLYQDNIDFVNACSLDEKYDRIGQPISIYIDNDGEVSDILVE